MKKYNFLAIGDIVTDAFIRLEDPSAHIDIDRGNREICMRFAEKIPYESVHIVPAVGNSANAAVCASRLGLKSALVTNVGNDYFGKECLATLKTEKVGTEFIKIHKDKKTNYHYVLWYDDDRTILIKHEDYSYALPKINAPEWIYLSSLGPNTLPFHKTLEGFFNQYPNIKLAFQPGTYQIKFSQELLGIYKRTKVVLCNKEEAERILGVEENDVKKLLRGMRELGPEIIVITDGVKGVYAFDGSPSTSSGQNSRDEFWFMPPYPDPKPPFERTGAGDAFSATFVAALCFGLDLEEALRWAPINAMSVVQYVGAREGLLCQDKLKEYLGKAPTDYKPRLI